MIKRVSILGPGLLGGSIALAVKKNLPKLELILWGRREEPLEIARAMGVTCTTTHLAEAVSGVDLCIMATPVGVMKDLVRQIITIQRDAPLLLTDVGSVKRLPHAELAPLIKDSAVHFIGSHPMAGSEKTGMNAAQDDLIDGATCLITNEGNEAESNVKILEMFWQSLGCSTRRMSAEDHDYAVARVSHFPHLLAAVGAKVGLAYEDIVELCGGGMRDTTRVAAGDPALWTEILMENRDALQRSIHESIADMIKLKEYLNQENQADLHAYLTLSKERRERL
jgi:prephenate dehydrogenase